MRVFTTFMSLLMPTAVQRSAAVCAAFKSLRRPSIAVHTRDPVTQAPFESFVCPRVAEGVRDERLVRAAVEHATLSGAPRTGVCCGHRCRY